MLFQPVRTKTRACRSAWFAFTLAVTALHFCPWLQGAELKVVPQLVPRLPLAPSVLRRWQQRKKNAAPGLEEAAAADLHIEPG